MRHTPTQPRHGLISINVPDERLLSASRASSIFTREDSAHRHAKRPRDTGGSTPHKPRGHPHVTFGLLCLLVFGNGVIVELLGAQSSRQQEGESAPNGPKTNSNNSIQDAYKRQSDRSKRGVIMDQFTRSVHEKGTHE